VSTAPAAFARWHRFITLMDNACTAASVCPRARAMCCFVRRWIRRAAAFYMMKAGVEDRLPLSSSLVQTWTPASGVWRRNRMSSGVRYAPLIEEHGLTIERNKSAPLVSDCSVRCSSRFCPYPARLRLLGRRWLQSRSSNGDLHCSPCSRHGSARFIALGARRGVAREIPELSAASGPRVSASV